MEIPLDMKSLRNAGRAVCEISGKVKSVYAVTDCGKFIAGQRVGYATMNQDGSQLITLESLPLGGKIYIHP